MTIPEMINVMKACEEGKTIQCSYRGENAWIGAANPIWDWDKYDYRIKPEPKYVPYDNISEVDKDKWIKSKSNDILSRIMALDARDSDSSVELRHYGWCSLKELFEYYTYEDGTPCGKKVEA